jgi:DNA segregation ATPase FtsK/SpoIIIE, S-DNA-T family
MGTVARLTAELEAARRTHVEWLEKAHSIAAELQAAIQAATRRTVGELNGNAEDYAAHLRSEPASCVLGFEDPAWEDHSADEHGPLDRIRLGTINETDLMAGETGIHGLAALVPFLAAQGPFLVLCDEASQGLARNLIQALILRTAVTMPAEAKFALIDPIGLGSAFPMRGLLPKVRPTGRSVADELNEVLDDVRRINQDVIGHADRFAHLTSQERAGEQFEIIAVMDFPEAYKTDPRAVDHIVKIGNAGPRAGRHLLVEVRADRPLPRDFALDQFKDAYTLDLRVNTRLLPFIPDAPPSGAGQRRLIEAAQRTANHARAGDWKDLVRPEAFFAESAERRVETPIGERVSLWLGEADDEHASAHAMIAGQVGSGKSYLLHVFITGLASRYSPGELRFALIDGKQGVEFEAYRQLPHADVVCLRTSPEMARRVLEDFSTEMDDRYERFQRANVVKLEDYRRKTGEIVPRMILMVDEYQQLLEGDPEHGARLLRRVIEKGRAAGTHLVLGSQTFNVQGLPQSVFKDVQLRASLFLAQDYLQGIVAFGSEGKRLIRELAPSGEVVVNDRSGADGANKRSAVARLPKADDGGNALTDAVGEIVAAAQARFGSPKHAPIVLSGRDGAILADNPFVARWRSRPPAPETLQATARSAVRKGGFGIDAWSMADNPVPLWFGRKFDVRGHALAVLRRAPGSNLLMLGPNASVRLGALANALAGLAGMIPAGELTVDLVDGLSPGLPGDGLLRAGLAPLEARGAQVRPFHPGNVEQALAALAADLGDRQAAAGAQNARRRLLVISEPEYVTALHLPPQSFGPPPKGAPAMLRDLIQRGPQAGIHVIVTASGLSALGIILNVNRELHAFSHRIVQQMNEHDSTTLFQSVTVGARVAERADHPCAMLLVDQLQGARAGYLFKAYGADHDIFADQTAAALAAALKRLFG